jgi:hypothetical protein
MMENNWTPGIDNRITKPQTTWTACLDARLAAGGARSGIALKNQAPL